jgi:hypothetical protein
MGKLGTKVIALSMFIIGVATGFFIYAIFQTKIEVLAPAAILAPVAIIIAILTWFGSGTDFIKMLRDWLKEKTEEEKRIASLPKLKIVYDEENPHQYCPIQSDTRIEDFGTVQRKYLRIEVENNGGEVARDCNAKLIVIEKSSDLSPTTELKYLQWTKENEISMDIRAQGEEFLNVVFSMNKDISGGAYVATTHSLNGPSFPREKDRFGVGEYAFKVEVNSESGQKTDAVFKLKVTENWEELTMKMIEDPIFG